LLAGVFNSLAFAGETLAFGRHMSPTSVIAFRTFSAGHHHPIWLNGEGVYKN
jgi:hypothetical protein